MSRFRLAASLLSLVGVCFGADSAIPRLVHEHGHYGLFVDGEPFLMLGAQVNNSSAWPAMLPSVWPAIDALDANTVEMPVYWEQLEPQPDRFDFTVVDTLLAQSREHHVHLVLLWFGTWKNGSSHYVPLWMKLQPDRYPGILNRKGRPLDSLSPHSTATLEADIHAFTALMRHLKEADPQHTVLMVQIENETGTYGTVRDYSPAAEKAFQRAVPAGLLNALHEPAVRSASWSTIFGADAEEFFHAWSIARYVEQIAAAGKTIYPLPMYVNVALRDPFKPGPPGTYASGGPTDNVIAVWKAGAPSLDLIAPDIYMSDSRRYLKILDLYDRPDNAMFVPETGNSTEYARYFFAALNHHTIGFSPFGMDFTGYSNFPLGARKLSDETVDAFALNYRLIAPMDREIARLSFEGKMQAVVEQKNIPSDTLSFGPWTSIISYGLPQFGPGDHPPGNPEPVGRALVAQLDENEFLVAGFFCRVDFRVSDPASTKQREFLRVEEGHYQQGTFQSIRIWNGDQTDWGLNFTSTPQVLRVSLRTY